MLNYWDLTLPSKTPLGTKRLYPREANPKHWYKISDRSCSFNKTVLAKFFYTINIFCPAWHLDVFPKLRLWVQKLQIFWSWFSNQCWASSEPRVKGKVVLYRKLPNTWERTSWKPLHRPTEGDRTTGAAPGGKSHMDLKELHCFIFIYILIYLEVALWILRSLSKSVEPCAVSTMAAGKAAQGWFRIHTQFRIWGSNAPHNEIHLLRKLALLKKKHSAESQGTSKAP